MKIMIVFDSFPTYTKQAIAIHQLDKAICLLLDDNDPISAITLAGAAEEILGKLVEKQGDRHALGEFVDLCVDFGKLQGEEWGSKIFVEIETFYRNELKHFCDAYAIIDRAATNLFKLTNDYTKQVNRYMSYVHGV